jgi:hypothetical protein
MELVDLQEKSKVQDETLWYITQPYIDSDGTVMSQPRSMRRY